MTTRWAAPRLMASWCALAVSALTGCPPAPATTCLTVRDCDPSQACVAGRCVAETRDASYFEVDGGRLVDASDPSSDSGGPTADTGGVSSDGGPDASGSPDASASPDASTSPDAGACPSSSDLLCGAECVDPMVDERYCGDCLTTCAVGSTCWDAACGFRELLYLFNRARATARPCGATAMAAVPPLVWSVTLEAASLPHAQDMAARRMLTFTGADGSDPMLRATNAGYRPIAFIRWGIILMGYEERLPDVVDMLVADPETCMSIMSPSATELGGAAADGPPDGIYWAWYVGRRS